MFIMCLQWEKLVMEDNVYDLIIRPSGITFLINEKVKFRNSLKQIISFIQENELDSLEVLNIQSNQVLKSVLKRLEKECNLYQYDSYENRVSLRLKNETNK